MRTCAATRSRLPPEPWLSSTAVWLRDGTYQPDSSRPSAVAIVTFSCAMPSEDSWIAQRGACVTISDAANGITATTAKTGTAASQAAPCASRQPSAGRRGARRGSAMAVSPPATSSRPPAIMPTPVRSVQSGPEFTTCRPCETTPKPNAIRPITTPRTSRVGRVTRGWASAQAAGTATIASTPGSEVSGPENARSSRWSATSVRPASRSGRSSPARRFRRLSSRRANGGTRGRGSARVAVISASLAPIGRLGQGAGRRPTARRIRGAGCGEPYREGLARPGC